MASPANKRNAEPVCDLVSAIIDPVLRKRAGVSVSLVQSWEEIAGPRLAATSRPERIVWPRRASDDDPFEPATLVVACEGFAALALQHETNEVIARVNAFLGFAAIGRVKIVQKPVRAPEKPKPRALRPLTGSEEQALAERLDGMFAVQAASFNRMLDRMEDMMRAQRQFASNLAHDLRTPLTRLRGLLAGRSGGEIPSDNRLIERAERECASIMAIFDALLRLSEIEAGRHPTAMQPLDLADVIKDVTETMEPVFADGGRTLDVGPLEQVTVIADAALLQQLLLNLLENVALHTPEGTAARISLFADPGGDAVLRVADDGPGLAEKDRLRLIRPFERGATGKSAGSGLGLAIARAIVDFHGGNLHLGDAAPGLAVEIRLPATGPIGSAFSPARRVFADATS